jgi:voltage-gated potassium channel
MQDPGRQISRRIAVTVALVLSVFVVGAMGYRAISDGASSWLDCLYMTVITVTTIGYGEIVDLAHHPGGRVFTMFVAFCGIGIITYVLSSVTQMTVDGEFRNAWRRRRMSSTIEGLGGHFVVCGWSYLVPPMVREFLATKRDFVLVVPDRAVLEREFGAEAGALLSVEGDPTDDDILAAAGIARAAGIVAAHDDDPVNIVVCMTARALNPGVRIVASVRDARSVPKMKKAGAAAVVSSIDIGAMRMASELVRPAAVSFLDQMLRDRTLNLRVDAVKVGATGAGRTLGESLREDFTRLLVMAVLRGGQWVYKPAVDFRLQAGDEVLVMSEPDERRRLEARLGAGGSPA